MTHPLRSTTVSIFRRYSLLIVFTAFASAAQVNSVVIMLTSPNPVVQGQQVTITAGVNWTATASPSGSITISDTCPDGSSSVLGNFVLGSNASAAPGSGVLQVPAFPCLGSNQLVATYSGDSSYRPGTSSVLLETVLDSFTSVSTTLVSSLNPAVVGQSINLVAQLSPTMIVNNTRPTGAVTFTDLNTGTVLGSAPVVNSGGGKQTFTSAYISVTPAAGTYAVQAAYSGDNLYSPGTSQVLAQVVQQSAPSTTSTSLTASSNQIFVGQDVTLSVTVSSDTGTPDGSVSFYDGSALLATVNLAAGQASLDTFSLSAVGDHFITATYGGSNNFGASSSTAVDVSVQPVPLSPTTTSLASSVNPATDSTPFDLVATVATSDSGIPSGIVTFQTDTTVLGTAGVQNGLATLTVVLPAGTYSLSAVYSGDTTYSGSTGSLTESVNSPSLTPTAANLTSSSNPSMDGQEVSFIATIIGSDGGVPTGSVTFNAGPLTAVVNLDTNGTAAFNTAALPDGSNNVTAIYSGDSTYDGSTSPTLVQSVVPPPPAVQVSVNGTGYLYNRQSGLFTSTLTATNDGTQTVPGPIQALINNLPSGVSLKNASGVMAAAPYILIPGNMDPGQSASFTLQFANPQFKTISYDLRFNPGAKTAMSEVQAGPAERHDQ